MIVLQLNEGQDPGSSANRAYEIINRTYEDQVKGKPYITAEFVRDESRTVFIVGDGKNYSRSAITEAKRKRKDTSELTMCKNCSRAVAWYGAGWWQRLHGSYCIRVFWNDHNS